MSDPVTRVSDPARYARQLRVIGASGQDALARAKVLIVGAGGLGAPAILYLAGAGVGTIGIVDPDSVEVSNLHRQVVHDTAGVGQPKVASAVAAAAALNPGVTLEAHEVAFTDATALDLARGYDLVLDGSDNFETRYTASDACEILGIPHVWGSVLRYEGQLSVFHAGHGPTYRDIFPALPPAGSVPSCAEAGVLGVVPGTLGMAMATEALKLILGVGEPLIGRLATYDALTATWEHIPILPDPLREPVTRMGAGRESATPVGDAGHPARGAGSPGAGPAEITVAELAAALDAGGAPPLLDVREPWEAQIATLEGSVLVPLAELEPALATGWRPEPGELVVFCAAGVRSHKAQAVLAEAGVASRSLAGGIGAWQDAGHPVSSDALATQGRDTWHA